MTRYQEYISTLLHEQVNYITTQGVILSKNPFYHIEEFVSLDENANPILKQVKKQATIKLENPLKTHIVATVDDVLKNNRIAIKLRNSKEDFPHHNFVNGGMVISPE